MHCNIVCLDLLGVVMRSSIPHMQRVSIEAPSSCCIPIQLWVQSAARGASRRHRVLIWWALPALPPLGFPVTPCNPPCLQPCRRIMRLHSSCGHLMLQAWPLPIAHSVCLTLQKTDSFAVHALTIAQPSQQHSYKQHSIQCGTGAASHRTAQHSTAQP